MSNETFAQILSQIQATLAGNQPPALVVTLAQLQVVNALKEVRAEQKYKFDQMLHARDVVQRPTEDDGDVLFA